MRGKIKFQQMNVYFLAQLGTMQTDQNKRKSCIQAKSMFKCHTGASGIKRGKKMHILYTNHMYLLSVVSNVNVKRKTPIMIFFYTQN